MLDYTQSFEQFSQSVKPLDLALYAGAGLILWALFKEKLSPLQTWLGSLISQIKANKPISNIVKAVDNTAKKEDVFFDLVASWKQTRDLAVKSGCVEAVKVADQMFPFLSPNGCGKNGVNV